MSDTKLKDLNNLLLFMHPINCELAVIDGTGHTSDYADHYYAKIRDKCQKKLHKKPYCNGCRHKNDPKLRSK